MYCSRFIVLNFDAICSYCHTIEIKAYLLTYLITKLEPEQNRHIDRRDRRHYNVAFAAIKSSKQVTDPLCYYNLVTGVVW